MRTLAFAADAALWAGLEGGAVRWDVSSGAPRHFTAADGLAGEVVNDLLFRQDGALWSATSSSISRYDGESWHPGDPDGDLGKAAVYSLAASPDGGLWAGTEHGLYRYDGVTWQQHMPADPAVASQLIWSVDVAPDGTVWASTYGAGVLRYQPATGRWTIYTAPEHFPYPNARVLAVAPDGSPWVHIGYDNVYRFDGEEWRLSYASGGGQWVCGIAFDAASLPWIATCGGFHAYGHGLAHYDGQQWSYTTVRDGLPSDDLTSLAISPGGALAVGSHRGAAVFQDGSWRMLRSGPALRRVTAVAALPSGVVFAFGDNHAQAAGGGLSYYEDGQWRYGDGGDGLPADANIEHLALSPSGELWAAGGCAVYRRAGARWETAAGCDRLQGPVTGISVNDNGAAWIGTPFALFRAHGGALETFEGRSALALADDRAGSLWVLADSLHGGALSTFDGRAWQDRMAEVPGTPVSPLAADAYGGIWVGLQEGGLAHHDETGWRRVTAAAGLPFEHVSLLASAADGTLWAASGASVARLSAGSWQRYDVPTTAISALSPAPDGSTWLATDSGAYHLKP